MVHNCCRQLNSRDSGQASYVAVDLVHVGGEFFSCEFLVDVSEAGVGYAGRRAGGVRGLVEAESPGSGPAVPAWRLTHGGQVSAIEALQKKTDSIRVQIYQQQGTEPLFISNRKMFFFFLDKRWLVGFT